MSFWYLNYLESLQVWVEMTPGKRNDLKLVPIPGLMEN